MTKLLGRFIKHEIRTESHFNDIALGDKSTAYYISFTPKGNIYVSDEINKPIVVFHHDGKYVGTVHSDGKITSWSPQLAKHVYINKNAIKIGECLNDY